jgi:hypothetical protein
MDKPESTAPPVPHADTDWPWKIPIWRRGGTVRAFALVDEGDHAEVASRRWHLGGGYAARRVGSARRPGSYILLLHRQLLGLQRGDPRMGDHENGDTLDYRRSNLRIVTAGGNAQNKKPYGRSKYRGVYFDTTWQRWKAEGTVNYRKTRLGSFHTEEEARDAALAFRTEHMPYAIER